MPRGVRKEVVYTGKAAKLNEKIQKMETELKSAREELKIASLLLLLFTASRCP